MCKSDSFSPLWGPGGPGATSGRSGGRPDTCPSLSRKRDILGHLAVQRVGKWISSPWIIYGYRVVMPFPELLLVLNEHEYAGNVRTHHLAQRAGVCRPPRHPAAVANRLV